MFGSLKMKGIIVASLFWTNLFSARKARAITIFPFIFVTSISDKTDQVLINHERIHLAQALELLILPFYLWYSIEFLIRFIRFRNFDKAYRNISFEKEAFRNETNLRYLKGRKVWSFWKYV